jgi:hypothetical protein
MSVPTLTSPYPEAHEARPRILRGPFAESENKGARAVLAKHATDNGYYRATIYVCSGAALWWARLYYYNK